MNSPLSIRLSHLLFSLILFLFASCAIPKKAKEIECIQNRTAVEVGSGTTKMQVATVDVCEEKIVKKLVTKDYKIDFKDDLQSRQSQELSPEIMTKALTALTEVQEISKRHGVTTDRTRGVATAVFREAQNTSAFLARVFEKTGLMIKVISQKEEAEIGLRSVRTQLPTEVKDLVVWDIGGGSLQLTYQDDPNRDLVVYEGKLASVNFKNAFIKQVKQKDPAKHPSPNPIQKTEVKKAIKIIQDYLNSDQVPPLLREKVKELNVYGIGGVLTMSLPGQIQPKDEVIRYTDIQMALDRQMGKTDAQLKTKYAATEVTNLILVSTFMKFIGMEKYHIAAFNNTSGLLVESKYWR